MTAASRCSWGRVRHRGEVRAADQGGRRQELFLGNPEHGCDLQPIDFAAFARACGGAGFRIEDPGECGAVLDQALGTRGPVVVEAAVVDPFEPKLPPKITPRQAVKFAESLARGEPNRGRTTLAVLKDKVRELI